MNVAELQAIGLAPGILKEGIPGEDRFVAWIPESEMGQWKRVSTLPEAPVLIAQDAFAFRAVFDSIRQRDHGPLAKMWDRVTNRNREPEWEIPNGQLGDQAGPRVTGFILVWPAIPAVPALPSLDGMNIQRIGEGIFVLMPGSASLPRTAADDDTLFSNPDAWVSDALASLTTKETPQAKAMVLADIGAYFVRGCKGTEAIPHLEEARRLARAVPDPRLELDILNSLGMARLIAGDIAQALPLLQEALEACPSDDPAAAKLALTHLGMAESASGNRTGALSHFAEARILAQRLGDRNHEAELLWQSAIQHAETGDPEEASRAADRAVTLWKATENPHARWFADHLRQYAASLKASSSDKVRASFGTHVVSNLAPSTTRAAPTVPAPAFLQMAFAATESFARFVGSGLKLCAPEVRRTRLDSCAGCEHFTGLRCRACGCFVAAKARMLHEECPVGKWPRSLATEQVG